MESCWVQRKNISFGFSNLKWKFQLFYKSILNFIYCWIISRLNKSSIWFCLPNFILCKRKQLHFVSRFKWNFQDLYFKVFIVLSSSLNTFLTFLGATFLLSSDAEVGSARRSRKRSRRFGPKRTWRTSRRRRREKKLRMMTTTTMNWFVFLKYFYWIEEKVF